MPLINCPDCGKQISDAAEHCIGCGRPMKGSPSSEVQVDKSATEPDDDMACDGCGSTQLRKFSLLYEEQHTSSSSRTKMAGVGLAPSGLGVGIGGGSTSGTSMTQLARRIAPPNKKEMTKNDLASTVAAIVTLIAASVTAYLVYSAAGFVWAAIGFAIVFLAGIVIGSGFSTVDEQYRKARAEWNRKYMCMKCGATTFQSIKAHRAAAKRSSADPELDLLIHGGEKIQAVKRVRDSTGVSLAEALQVVEDRMKELS